MQSLRGHCQLQSYSGYHRSNYNEHSKTRLLRFGGIGLVAKLLGKLVHDLVTDHC